MNNTMGKTNTYNDDERQYLQMMQDNIARMATNSSNCKTWLVMLVAAIFAVSCGLGELNWWLLLSVFPIALFWYLDSFYLRLERGIRNRQRFFLNICAGLEPIENYANALFDFSPYFFDKDLSDEEKKKGYVTTKGCGKTESVKPFYLMVLVVVLIIIVVLNACDFIDWINSFKSNS